MHYDTNDDLITDGRFTNDAWGRLRAAGTTGDYDMSISDLEAFQILGRGYTGHEHLLDHDIINMNGRIYDPILGQFMQPDNSHYRVFLMIIKKTGVCLHFLLW